MGYAIPNLSLDMSLISRKISSEVKAVTCEMCKGNTLTLPCSGTVWRGCFLHALAEVGGTWMPKSQAVGILFTPMEIAVSAAVNGACYLSGLAPETLGAWCGSLKVKKLSTEVFVSDSIGLIFGAFFLATAGSFMKVSFMKCSGTEFVRR